MNKIIIIPLVCVSFMLTTSCATIFKGNKQVMQFTSEPSGAEVQIDGNSMGKTPLTVMLKKNTYSLVTFTKEGYSSVTKPISKQYDAVTLLSTFWDLSTTDFISGAAYEYEPNMYHVNLEKSQGEENKELNKSKK